MKSIVTGVAGVRFALCAGIAAAALIAPAAAFAQEVEEEAQPAADQPAEEATADEGNEIIVTATKREQTLQDVPVAVSVTTAETIERAQIRDLKDLQSIVPSLRVTQLQSSANTNFIIRGFGNGANNAGIEPSVGVFVDGVYRSRTASQIGDLPDVQRIEVLRGPQSTLFGKNASAGVISIVTREPQFQFGGNVEASYGNFNAVVVKGVVTGPITENIAASIAGGINKRDGYIDDLGTGTKTNERDRWFVRGQLLIEPTEQLKIRIIGDYDKIDENCCGVVNLQPSAATGALQLLGGRVNDFRDPFADVTYGNFASTNDIENYGVSGTIEYGVGPLTLTSITAYRETRAITNQDSDFTSADLLGRNFQDLKLKTFTQELRASTDLDGPVNFVVGGFYFNEKVNQTNQLLYGTQFRPYADLLIRGATANTLNVATVEALLGAGAGNPAAFTNRFFIGGQGLTEGYQLANESYSAFGQVDFALTDRLTATGGLNYTRDTKNFSTNVVSSDVFSSITLPAAFAALRPLQFLPQFLNLPNAVEPGRTRDSNVSYTARLAFDATDTVNLYASYATGFKASSVNLSRDSRPLASDAAALTAAGLTRPNQTYGTRFAGPEKSKVFEFGMKANWDLVTANLAVFKQSIDGFQSNTFTGTGFALTNAGKQSTFGFEFDGSVRPVDPLLLTLSVVYLDPKYDSFVASPLGDASGREPAGIPNLAFTMGGQYTHEFGNGDKLILRGDYHYESQVQIVEGLPGFIQRNSAGQIISYDAALAAGRRFTREVDDVNASLTYAMDAGFELSIWGRNLLNDRYLLQVFDSVAQSGSISGYPNQPRTYGASARFKF